MKKSPTDFPKFPSQNLNVSGQLSIVPKSVESCPFRRLVYQWLDDGRANGLAIKTLDDYQDKIFKFYWWWTEHSHFADNPGVHPKNVTSQVARQFAAYLREKVAFRWGITKPTNNKSSEILSPTSIASYGRSVKVFFNWLEREEYIEKSPFNRSVRFTNRNKQDKVLKTVTAEDLSNIFKALTQPEKIATYTGVRNLAIMAMLIDSGIRRGELLSIQVKDLELEYGRCTVRGKSGQRVAHFGDLCRSALINYLQHPLNENLEQESPLWLTESGEPLSYDGFGMIIRRLEKASGVDFHAHRLRHTFATMMAQQGTNVFDLKEMLGHSSITTTQIYVQQNVEHLSEVYRAKSPLSVLAGQDKVKIKRKGRPRTER